MSDTEERDAVLARHSGGGLEYPVYRAMAEENLRLRDENAALRAEINRLREDLSTQADWADWAEGEIEWMRDAAEDSARAERILAALREPSEKVVDAVHGIELREEWYAQAQLHAAIIRAAVTAAEQEVGA